MSRAQREYVPALDEPVFALVEPVFVLDEPVTLLDEHVTALDERVVALDERVVALVEHVLSANEHVTMVSPHNVNDHRAAAIDLQAEKSARPAAPCASYCYPALGSTDKQFFRNRFESRFALSA